MDSILVLKIKYGEDNRRITLHSVPSLHELISTITKLLNVSRFSIKYVDEEGDQITVSNDIELKEAIHIALQHHNGVLRLIVLDSHNNFEAENNLTGAHCQTYQPQHEVRNDITVQQSPSVGSLQFIPQLFQGLGSLTQTLLNSCEPQGTIPKGVALTSVTPESYGAVGNGVTNDQVALQNWLNALNSTNVGLATPGKVYAHNNVLKVSNASSTITAYGAVFLATVPVTSAFQIIGANSVVNGGTFRCSNATTRGGNLNDHKLILLNSTGVKVSGVRIEGSNAAGIFVYNSKDFILDRPIVLDTLADGIHITNKSSNGTLLSPVVCNSGDDGVAVVSYLSDTAVCHHINILSPKVYDQKNGRGITVVGGEDINYTDVEVHGSYGAAVYIAIEQGTYQTFAVKRVNVRGGRLVNSVLSTTLDHGAIFLLSWADGKTVENVNIGNIEIVDCNPSRTAINTKNGGSTGQFLNCTVHDIQFHGRYNLSSPTGKDSGVVVTYSNMSFFPPAVIRAVTTVTASYSVKSSDEIILAKGAITVTLPSATFPDATIGKLFNIRNAGTATVTVASGSKVDGLASVSLAAGAKAAYASDGTTWWSV